MGCDIHTYTEALVNGKWIPIGAVGVDWIWDEKAEDEFPALAIKSPYRDRNYSLFSVLAGVRGEGPAIIPPRGVPDDMNESIAAEYERWGCDAHTAHHYYLSELIENRHQFEREEDWGDGKKYKVGGGFLNTLDDLTELAKRYEIDPEDVRIVFWFDN